MKKSIAQDGKRLLSRVKRLALAAIVVALSVLAWGLIEPYIIDVEKYEVTLANLPDEWHGRRVAVIGDTQVGMWLDNTRTVRRVAEHLTTDQPDVALLVGDFIYHGGKDPEKRIQEVVRLLQPLTDATVPLYAVLGNHDYSATSSREPNIRDGQARQLKAALTDAGILVLENEAVPLFAAGSDSGNPLYVAGIGPHLPRKDRPQEALAEIPEDAPRLVMMHNPASFAGIRAGGAPLAVAGHTHGGQIRLPFPSPEWSMLSLITEGPVHTDGWIEEYGSPGNRLYVNRGIGFSIIPLRINCRPEITYFTLLAGNAAGPSDSAH